MGERGERPVYDLNLNRQIDSAEVDLGGGKTDEEKKVEDKSGSNYVGGEQGRNGGLKKGPSHLEELKKLEV